MMTIKNAETLVKSLRREGPGKVADCAIVREPSRRAVRGPDGRLRWEACEAGFIVFRVNGTELHRLAIECSDRARVLAHWSGFCEAHRLAIKVGGIVEFFSPSAPSRFRRARVLAHTGTTVRLAFRFAYMSREASPIVKTVPERALRIVAF